jgi:peptidyl-prolyl cis-trans isomerase D
MFYAELPKPADADKKPDEKKGDKKDAKAIDPSLDRAAFTIQTHPNRPAIETTLPFNVSNDPIPGARAAEVTKVAFSLDKPGDAPPDALSFEAGYLVVQLKEKTPASKEQWDKNKDFYIGAMRAAKANDALVAYVKRLQGQLAGDAKYTASVVEDKATKGGEAPAPVDDDSGE